MTSTELLKITLWTLNNQPRFRVRGADKLPEGFKQNFTSYDLASAIERHLEEATAKQEAEPAKAD